MSGEDGGELALSFAERWILANQYEILKRLDADGHSFYEQVIEILSNGYESEYKYAAQYISPTVLDSQVSDEVRAILTMFTQMKWHEHEIVLPDLRHKALFHFWGFDGNNNPEHLRIADFLIRKGEFRDLGLCGCPNSHSDTIGTYRSMVGAWKKFERKGIRMTLGDIETILDAPIIEALPMPNVPPYRDGQE